MKARKSLAAMERLSTVGIIVSLRNTRITSFTLGPAPSTIAEANRFAFPSVGL